MSTSTIALIALGIIVFFGLLAFGIWIWMARKMFKQQAEARKEFEKRRQEIDERRNARRKK